MFLAAAERVDAAGAAGQDETMPLRLDSRSADFGERFAAFLSVKREAAQDVEAAVREGRIGYEESGLLLRFYEEGLNGYTYLEQ